MSFIQTGKARQILKIESRRTMQDLLTRKALLHIRLGNNRSRLLPESYVLGIARYQHGRELTSALVRQFNASQEGRQLIIDAQKNLSDTINARPEHTSEEVAAIFGVERKTVSDWVRCGTLQAEIKARQGMVVTSSNPLSQRYAITAITLRGFATWVTPV